MPFRVVDSIFFQKFVEGLIKFPFEAYKPPCRQTLANSIMKRVRKTIRRDRRKKFKNTKSILMLDVWKNKAVNRKFLVFTMRNFYCAQAFLKAVDVSMDTEDGAFITTEIKKAVNLARRVYHTDVYAAVTDNEATMKCGVRNAVNFEEDENLWQNTCSSHSTNLFFTDWEKMNTEFVKIIESIITGFRDPKVSAFVEMEGGKRMLKFPDTRWCYLRDALQRIHDNLSILKRVMEYQTVKLTEDAREKLNDENFPREIQNCIDLFTPLCKLINKSQDPSFNVAESTQFWLQIKEQLPVRTYNEIIDNRIKKALWPVGFAANLLHNRFRGNLLTDDQRRLGEMFIFDNLDFQGRAEWADFNFVDEFYQPFCDQCQSAIHFWCLAAIKVPHLASFAIKLMVVPASTALIESFFSTWKYVHSPYRNRLQFKKSCVMTDIYYSLIHDGKKKVPL